MQAPEPYDDATGRRAAQRPQRTLVGQTLAERYDILAPLARGAMGRIYRARQRLLDREVALKIFGSHASFDVESSLGGRFLLEAASAAKVVHPHSVTIYDYGERDGIFYMAMELLDGQSLAERLAQPRALFWRESVALGMQIARALAAAHSQNVVHRDVKPANIFLVKSDDGSPYAKVIDYGLVKLTCDAEAMLTRVGTLLGTPGYMSPEQVRGEVLGPQTDIYALGATLYEMLAGLPPLARGAPLETMMAHVYEEPSRLNKLADGTVCPPKLADLIGQMLAKDSSKRPKSMRAVVRALANVDTHFTPRATAQPLQAFVPESTGWSVMGATGLLHPRSLAPGHRAHGLQDRPTILHADVAIHSPRRAGVWPEKQALPIEVTDAIRPPQSRCLGRQIRRYVGFLFLLCLPHHASQAFRTVRLFLSSEPPGAKVFLGADCLCRQTPCVINRQLLCGKKRLSLRFVKSGHEEFIATRQVSTDMAWFRVKMTKPEFKFLEIAPKRSQG